MNSNRLKYLPTGITPVLILAAAVRIIYWLQAHNQAWFQTPGMDPEFYQEWASAILTGHGASWLPFPRGPLYCYALAGIWAIFGKGWLAPRLFNLAADLIAVWAVYKLGQRLGGKRAGLLGALLFAFCGASIYYSGELLMTSLETALAALVVLSLAASFEKPSLIRGGLAGLAIGLLSLCRPNALPLIIIAPLGGFLLRPSSNLANRRNLALAMLAIGVFTISPALYYNYRATGAFVPVATQGGVNFYIGNARSANGWASILPGVEADWTDADAAQIANVSAGQVLNRNEQSMQLYRLGLREITADPMGWGRLMLKKLMLLINVREIGNNRPLALPREASPMLRLLFLLSLGALLPFALIGLAALRKSPATSISYAMFVIVFAGSLLFFFINTRYRMPLLPAIAALAGVGIYRIAKGRNERQIIKRHSIILAAGALLILPPWAGSQFDNPAQGYYVAANALMRQGRNREATDYYQRAADLENNYPKLHLNWGAALLALGDTTGAEAQFREELGYRPESPEASNNLGVIAEGRGHLSEAEYKFRSALSIKVNYPDARLNLTRILLKQGDTFINEQLADSAADRYQQAVDFSPADPKPHMRLAALYASLGDYANARAEAERTLEVSANYQPALHLLQALPPAK